ncbi:unnamed protein product [Prorocentrum cordatum]|uniref:PARP-type domain-containing protein n=1 Tax=Prorocentrum cordatum TaxID=2364126 RepID=A0ABN9X3I3_9DINO|nr:unnamed protein product [Polarella glacialis]
MGRAASSKGAGRDGRAGSSHGGRGRGGRGRAAAPPTPPPKPQPPARRARGPTPSAPRLTKQALATHEADGSGQQQRERRSGSCYLDKVCKKSHTCPSCTKMVRVGDLQYRETLKHKECGKRDRAFAWNMAQKSEDPEKAQKLKMEYTMTGNFREFESCVRTLVREIEYSAEGKDLELNHDWFIRALCSAGVSRDDAEDCWEHKALAGAW